MFHLTAIVEYNAITGIDFLKIDLDGDGLAALQGAQKALRAFKPNLAIRLGDEPTDLIEISAYIKGLNLGYRLYLGNHAPCVSGSILYAQAK